VIAAAADRAQSSNANVDMTTVLATSGVMSVVAPLARLASHVNTATADADVCKAARAAFAEMVSKGLLQRAAGGAGLCECTCVPCVRCDTRVCACWCAALSKAGVAAASAADDHSTTEDDDDDDGAEPPPPPAHAAPRAIDAVTRVGSAKRVAQVDAVSRDCVCDDTHTPAGIASAVACVRHRG
jgi:hypothetical protein